MVQELTESSAGLLIELARESKPVGVRGDTLCTRRTVGFALMTHYRKRDF